MGQKQNAQRGMGQENLMEGYRDLFMEMEGTLESFEILHNDIRCALDDIYDEMGHLQESMDSCAAALRACRRQERGQECLPKPKPAQPFPRERNIQ